MEKRCKGDGGRGLTAPVAAKEKRMVRGKKVRGKEEASE